MPRIHLAALALSLVVPAIALADDVPPGGGPTDPYGQPSTDPAPPQQPQPQPYPPQPYPPQPYPPQPYYYPPQPPPPPPGPPPKERTGELELIADGAALGILSTITLLVYRDYDDPGTGTLLVMGGALGGAGLGWIVADKMQVTRGEANAGTLGMALGLANGALLLVPTKQTDSAAEVLGTLTLGGTVGLAGGLVAGRALDLTRGQGMFAGTLTLLGVGTSLIVSALMDDENGEFDSGESAALAIGMDGGAIAGLAIAPKVQWSYRRSRFVLAATAVGTFLGGMIGGLAFSERDEVTGDNEPDPDAVAGSLLVGMWGGFAGGIMLSKDWAPDPKFAQPTAPPTGIAPMVTQDGFGISATGTF